MNDPSHDACAAFEYRLNDWIDQSGALDRSNAMHSVGRDETHPRAVPSMAALTDDIHLRDCDRCRQTLHVWIGLDPLLQSRSRRPRRSWTTARGWITAASLAASVAFLVLTLNSADRSDDPRPIAGDSPVAMMPTAASATAPMRLASSPIWVVDTQSWQDWLSRSSPSVTQLSPAVTKLQIGVEPIRRTLTNAARIFSGSGDPSFPNDHGDTASGSIGAELSTGLPPAFVVWA